MKSTRHAGLFKLALTVAFAALIPTTVMVQIRAPVLAGYFNIQDAVVFIAALLFGPTVGGLSGGVGSAISDIIYYPLFAPYTLVIKGIEGWLVGKTTRRTLRSDWIACVLGGIEMVLASLVLEIFLSGVDAALERVSLNIFQVVAGVAIAPPTALLLRRKLPSNLAFGL